ncbi:hypothetical protein HDU80_004420 [Chytriomyces hyalinus]|nr:hypothetical protein HDU80_004420 [Chytriomyces hyalinus]
MSNRFKFPSTTTPKVSIQVAPASHVVTAATAAAAAADPTTPSSPLEDMAAINQSRIDQIEMQADMRERMKVLKIRIDELGVMQRRMSEEMASSV